MSAMSFDSVSTTAPNQFPNRPSIATTSAGNGSSSGSGGPERKRKRKSRWAGGEDDKTFIPGMPTMLPQGLNKDQEQAYLCKCNKLNELSCLL